jgi:hypothetical protein
MVWDRRVFLTGQAVSLLGDGLAFLAIPLLVLEFSRSPLVSALSAASLTIGYLPGLRTQSGRVIVAGTDSRSVRYKSVADRTSAQDYGPQAAHDLLAHHDEQDHQGEHR